MFLHKIVIFSCWSFKTSTRTCLIKSIFCTEHLNSTWSFLLQNNGVVRWAHAHLKKYSKQCKYSRIIKASRLDTNWAKGSFLTTTAMIAPPLEAPHPNKSYDSSRIFTLKVTQYFKLVLLVLYCFALN